jgi:hypothetical protein
VAEEARGAPRGGDGARADGEPAEAEGGEDGAAGDREADEESEVAPARSGG